MIDAIYPTVTTDDFARRFSKRGGNLMWLLGAGASAAADMGHDLGVQAATLRQPAPRFPETGRRPRQSGRPTRTAIVHRRYRQPARPPGSPDEYAALFESVHPSEADRLLRAVQSLEARRDTFDIVFINIPQSWAAGFSGADGALIATSKAEKASRRDIRSTAEP